MGAVYSKFLDTGYISPSHGMQLSALNYGRVKLFAEEYETLARWNSKVGATAPGEDWETEEFVKAALPASLNSAGCWQLSQPLWLVVFKSDWLNTTKPNSNNFPTTFLVRALTQNAAHQKARSAMMRGWSDEAVPVDAAAYHHLFSQGFFFSGMPEGMREQLVYSPSEGFNVSQLSRSALLTDGSDGLGPPSFVFNRLKDDFRHKLLCNYHASHADGDFAHAIEERELRHGEPLTSVRNQLEEMRFSGPQDVD